MEQELFKGSGDLERVDSTRGKRGDVLASDLLSHAGNQAMQKQKQELTSQVAGAAQEIEHLHIRQRELEKEKQQLEAQARQQETYETGKRDIMVKLDRGIAFIDKEGARAVHLSELLTATRTRFKDALTELSDINEEAWPEDAFQVQLDRAVAQVEMAENEYKQSLARIDAAALYKGSGARGASAEPAANDWPRRHGFGYWLMVGLAVGFPFMLFFTALFFCWLHFTRKWLLTGFM